MAQESIELFGMERACAALSRWLCTAATFCDYAARKCLHESQWKISSISCSCVGTHSQQSWSAVANPSAKLPTLSTFSQPVHSMLANVKLIQPLQLQPTQSARSACYTDVLDLLLDPLLAQLSLQARIVSLHQLDDAARVFAPGR
jgi:hypothetical protein